MKGSSVKTDCLQKESAELARAWDRHSHAFLREYLVRNVQDPRINLQSILLRHFLIRELFGEAFCSLEDHEIRFALAANWVLGLWNSDLPAAALREKLDRAFLALAEPGGPDAAAVPEVVAQTFRMLEFPNYISALLSWMPADEERYSLPEGAANTFETLWREQLAGPVEGRLSVLEAGCGSANEYRFLHSFGLSPFLEYRGLDIARKNIENARRLFPEAAFQTGTVFDIEARTDAFDCCFTHDLLEHLSPAGMERALRELCRVTRRRIYLGFFNMSASQESVIEKREYYHWNRLGAGHVEELLAPMTANIQKIHLDSLLQTRYGCAGTCNPNAWSWLVELKPKV